MTLKVKSLGNNKTEIQINKTRILVSYKTPVACLKFGRYYVTDKHWSVTTSKHINQWLPDGILAHEKSQSWFDALLD